MLRRYHCLYERGIGGVEVDDLPMRQGETEGREGALGYMTRRMRKETDEMIRQQRSAECVALLFRSETVEK